MTGWLRLAARLPLFISFLLLTAILALTLKLGDLIRRRAIDRAPWARRCLKGAIWCLGIRVIQHGYLSAGPALFVSNHVSWCDIPALGSLRPLTFLAKAEVGQWPLIGWLARQVGTLFIKRGSRKISGVVETLTDRLKHDESVLVFPEGTTTNGITVLPFHGRLISAAALAGVPVQPVSLAYRRNGRMDSIAPFIGDDDFIRHLCRLLRQPAVTVELIAHPPVFLDPSKDLSDAAVQLHSRVLEGVRALHSQKPCISPADGQQPLRHRWLRASR